MKTVKQMLAGLLGLLLVTAAQAQTDPIDAGADITAAADTATDVFNAFAGLSVAALVLAMVFAYARKGKR